MIDETIIEMCWNKKDLEEQIAKNIKLRKQIEKDEEDVEHLQMCYICDGYNYNCPDYEKIKNGNR